MDEMCKRYSFDPKYFLGFENFLGRALFSNPEFFDDNYSLYVRKIGVSPFFARRFVLPDLGQRKRIFHRRNGKTTRPRSIKIE